MPTGDVPHEWLEPASPGTGCTRRHAIKTFVAAAGGLLLGGPLSRVWAEPPWGETVQSEYLTPDGQVLKIGPGHRYDVSERQIAPILIRGAQDNRLCTVWTGLHENRERVLLRWFAPEDQSWGPVCPVDTGSQAGLAGAATAAPIGDGSVIAWPEFADGRWSIRSRRLNGKGDLDAKVIPLAGPGDPGAVHTRPALAALGDVALLVWQTRSAKSGEFAIYGRRLGPDGMPLGEPFAIAEHAGKDCLRPAVAAVAEGNRFAVVCDRQDGPGTQNVYLTFVDAATGRCGDALAVTSHPASDVAADVAVSADGRLVWVGWHSNRSGEDGWDIPRWYHLAALDVQTGQWFEPAREPAGRDLDARGTIQGFEFARLAVAPGGAVCVLGRPSHGFYLQYFSGDDVSPLYRLPEDGWGGRGRQVSAVFDGKGALWCARRDLRTNALHRIDGFADSLKPPALKPSSEPQNGKNRTLRGVTARYSWPEPPKDAPAFNLYFGDIHGHSWQSDGMGDPEDSYVRARDVFHDDFHALTDHDCFVGKRLTDAQWQEQKDRVEHYHRPGAFVTLFGQEWTTPRPGNSHGWGHFNVYTADPRIPLFDHTEPATRDLPDLYRAIRDYRAIAIPHHIGWTGVPWEQLDPDLTPAVEICSVHGAFEFEGNRPIPHRGGMKGNFLQDGLLAGKRVGVVGGSDQHGLIWQHGVCWKRNAYRAGLTGVWAPELTREAILDAIRARRTFATTGVKLCLRFLCGGHPMGSEVQSPGSPKFTAEVAVPPEEGHLDGIELVRDGVVVHTHGGEGQYSRFTFVDEQASEPGMSFYYARVTLRDNNMAWSSPIWVKRG